MPVALGADVHPISSGRTLRLVSAEVEPPELARLIDFAERPRAERWSLRAALCRYAQPNPERVSAILDLVRRIEGALHPHAKLVEREGRDLWVALGRGASPSDEPDGYVVGLLAAMTELDRLGDVLAEWAVDRAGERPDAAVDAVIADVAARLDALGVPVEDRTRPPRQRG
jgi:hypothetical protein